MTGRQESTGTAPPYPPGKRRQAGYALFFVLSLILLLSMLLMGIARDSRGQAKAALRTLQAAQVRADAETALSLTVMHLLAARPEDRWQADGSGRRLMIGEETWHVSITPEDGKVDINHARPALLTELFTAAGAMPDEAQTLADRIADWRDADDLKRPNGAERRAYESADLAPPRNGPFLKPEEIRRVMGMTEDLYTCIAPAVTVYSGRAGIDRRFAPTFLRRRQQDEPGRGAVASTSPLAFDSIAGKAVTVRLVPPGAPPRIAPTFVLRLTENPESPFWLLARQRQHSDGRGVPDCVSSLPPPRSGGQKSTPKG